MLPNKFAICTLMPYQKLNIFIIMACVYENKNNYLYNICMYK